MTQPFAKHLLPGGLRVITVPRPDSLATTILVMAETGSKYEVKEKSGLSHFFEHMSFKGTTRRPKPQDLSEEFDSLGAQYNAFTSQEYTGYYASFAPEGFDKALDLLADMYTDSIFPDQEIQKERGVIIEEINTMEDFPIRSVGDLLMSTMYGSQPAGWPILGTKESLQAISRRDFLDYQTKNYTAGATIVAVAGKFNEAEALKKIETAFLAAPAGQKAEKLKVGDEQKEPRLALKFKQSDQSHLRFGLRAYPAKDNRYYAAEIFAAILGGSMSSRLFRKIRDDLGAAYFVRASNDAYTDHGLTEIAVSADNRRVEEIIKVVLEELNKLRHETVSETELTRVKDFLVGNMSLELETSSGLANFYALEEILDGELRSPETVAKSLRGVTAAEVKTVAQEVVANDRLNLALIGPFKDEQAFVKALKV